jgi:23S rRNA U2552 (ribose-2'-O)-methylase RlmE/FtsJ
MNRKSLEIKIPDNNRILHNIKIKYSDTVSKIDINVLEYDLLMKYKNNISSLGINKYWDHAKKITNPYELVHLPTNRRKKNESIAFYNPLSRSYYKLWEIIDDFNILDNFDNNSIKTAHIAEGPGGFIESFLNKRKPIIDDINAITLKSDKKEVPGWRKGKYFIDRNPNITINYGADNTGNIYNIKNILHFTNYVGKNSCQFVTADGGFDYSIDFNKQEQLSYRLIFCEVVIAMSVQKEGGIFILKIFDSCTNFTVKIMWLLSCIYEKLIITKPFTSRQANSEKYLVALNFRGIDTNYLFKLYNLVNKWEYLEKQGYHIIDIFDGNTNPDFNSIIFNYNITNYYYQIENIDKTFNLIKSLKNDGQNSNKNEKILLERQIINALSWCRKYKVDINFKSKYLANKQEYLKYYDLIKYNKWLFHYNENQNFYKKKIFDTNEKKY